MNQAQALVNVGFDISKLDTLDAANVTHRVVVIKDVDGEDVSGFIIVGKNSAQYQEANNIMRKGNIQRSAKRSKQIDASTDEGATIVATTIEKNERAIALAVCVDWFGFTAGGQEMSFNKDTLEVMLDKMPQWRVLINQALDTDANFMKV